MNYKRWLDVGIIIAAHLFLAPVFLALWTGVPLLILLIDGRPIFFTQERVGRNGKVFRAYKFRTMVKNARKVGPSFTVENDPRVLPVIGRFLRATGLDELPQLINILKGDLSFVGPRPLPVEDYEKCIRTIPGFREREKLLPGLTGLAQLYADRLSWKEWLVYDMEYARRMNPLLDLEIIFLSVLTTLTCRWDRRGRRIPLLVKPLSAEMDREVSSITSPAE